MKILLMLLFFLFELQNVSLGEAAKAKEHKKQLALPVLHILVVFEPDVIPSGKYTKNLNHPVLQFVIMESLVPIRFNFAVNLKANEYSHGIDGQNFYSWQKTDIFDTLTLKAIAETKADMICLIGKKNIPEKTIAAVKLANRKGLPLLVFSGREELSKKFRVKLPELPLKQKNLFPLIYNSKGEQFSFTEVGNGESEKLLFFDIAMGKKNIYTNKLLFRNNSESEDAFAWYRLFARMSNKKLPDVLPASSKQLEAEVPGLQIKTEPEFTEPGEEVTITVMLPVGFKPESEELQLEFKIYDMAGRLLELIRQPVEQFPWKSSWRIPDFGPLSQFFRVKVVLKQNDVFAAKSERSIYVRRQFSPRERIYCGTWTMNSLSESELVMRFVKRFYDHAGMDSLHTREPKWLEKYGYWGCYEAGNGAFDQHFGWSFKSFDDITKVFLPRMRYSKTSAYNFISWGEEPGFKAYYSGIFPKHAHRWLQRFLKTRYQDIAELNSSWQTDYQSWKEVKLEKNNLGKKINLPVTDWDKIVDIRRESTLKNQQGKALPYIGKYIETQVFFNWYYDGVVNRFIKESREKFPFAGHFMSSPNSLHPKTPLASLSNHPFYHKERDFDAFLQHLSAGYNNPFAKLGWYFLDDPYLQANTLNRQLAVQTACFISWYDMPHQFNLDLTNSQGGARMNRVLSRLRKNAEGPYLQRYYDPESPIGIFYNPYYGNLLTRYYRAGGQFGIDFPEIWELLPSVYQTGFMPIYVGAEGLLKRNKLKVVILKDRMLAGSTIVILQKFVKAGGILIILPGSAAWNEHGVPKGNYMNPALVKLTGIAPIFGRKGPDKIAWTESSSFKPNSLQLREINSLRTFYENVSVAPDKAVTVYGKYSDGTPTVTMKQSGKGKVFYLNIGQWRKPNSGSWDHGDFPERRALTALFQAIFAQCKLKRPLPRLVSGKSGLGPQQVLWNRTYNKSKDITYLSGYLDARAKPLTTRILLARNTKVRDLLSGKKLKVDSAKAVSLDFARGQYNLIALRDSDPVKIQLKLDEAAGNILNIKLKLFADKSRKWTGQRPVRISFFKPDGTEAEKQRRWLSVAGEGNLEYGIALDDVSGEWKVEAWEPVSNLKQTVAFKVTNTIKRSKIKAGLYQNSSTEIVVWLRQLAKVYLTAATRPALSYYLQAQAEGSRHAIIRHLERSDWLQAEKTLLTALRNGETFILTGEDLGVFPGSDLATHGLFANNALAVLQKIVNSAKMISVPEDYPSTLVCNIGSGRLVLDRISLDETFPPSQVNNLGFPGIKSKIGEWVVKWRTRIFGNDAKMALKQVKKINIKQWFAVK